MNFHLRLYILIEPIDQNKINLNSHLFYQTSDHLGFSDKFIGNLKDLKKAIKSKNEKKLEKIFIKTKKIRKAIIEAGQDISKPDFGRK